MSILPRPRDRKFRERGPRTSRLTDHDTQFRDSRTRPLGPHARPGGHAGPCLVTAAPEQAAAERVLRSWRTGRVALSVYGAAAMALLWILAPLDGNESDLLTAIGIALAGGVALLSGVTVRNGWRGEDLALWEPELRDPATLVNDRRVARSGGTAFVTALFAISGFAVLVQVLGANHAAKAEAVATVTGCSSGYKGSSSYCYGRWTVAGRTYSGRLPGVQYASFGDTVHIRYDSEDPSSLGDRSTTRPLFIFLISSVLSGTMAWRWVERARYPYIQEVERIAARSARDTPAD
ncbi:hypothetical protein AB0L00_06820 [Actinoallomurus sp. NPDC052308]|uniref:hypothetical protein n=1 Tax=Actinoallomurus sp. NPDC052308 TaxID=3155530 RepID=UPI003427C337